MKIKHPRFSNSYAVSQPLEFAFGPADLLAEPVGNQVLPPHLLCNLTRTRGSLLTLPFSSHLLIKFIQFSILSVQPPVYQKTSSFLHCGHPCCNRLTTSPAAVPVSVPWLLTLLPFICSPQHCAKTHTFCHHLRIKFRVLNRTYHLWLILSCWAHVLPLLH